MQRSCTLVLADQSSGRPHRALALRLSGAKWTDSAPLRFILPYVVKEPLTLPREILTPPLGGLRKVLSAGPFQKTLPPRAPLSRRRTLATAQSPFVGLVRVELTTSRLSGVRSNHLSYRPKIWRVTASNHVSHQNAAIYTGTLVGPNTPYSVFAERVLPYTEKGGELRLRASMHPSPKGQAIS